MVRGHQHLIIPFIPLFCGGGVFVLFYWFTQYIGPFVIHQHTAQVCFASDLAIVTKAAFAEYLVIGHFLLLLVLEAGIVVFAIATVYCRRLPISPYITFKQFVTVTCCVALFAGVVLYVLKSLPGIGIGMTAAISAALKQMVGQEGEASLKDASHYLMIGRWGSVFAISAISAVVCCLVPTATYTAPSLRWRYGTKDLTTEIATQLRWLRQYLYAASLFLVCGVSFTRIALSWPLVYVAAPVEQLNDIRRLANGVLVYQAMFCIVLLLVIFVPVASRLLRARSRVAEMAMRSADDAGRRAWMAANGLTFTAGQKIWNGASLLLPAVVPLISLAVEFLS